MPDRERDMQKHAPVILRHWLAMPSESDHEEIVLGRDQRENDNDAEIGAIARRSLMS
jgi:hypothetical protein